MNVPDENKSAAVRAAQTNQLRNLVFFAEFFVFEIKGAKFAVRILSLSRASDVEAPEIMRVSWSRTSFATAYFVDLQAQI